jgi:5-methylcytosine-specific restriction endonuclease McrA
MLVIDKDLITEKIIDVFGEDCEATLIPDSQKRFSISLNFGEYLLILSGSDARVCVEFPILKYSKDLKDAMLFSICDVLGPLRFSLKPYKLTLWKNKNKNITSKPSLEMLMAEKELYLEICSRACDITTLEKAQAEAERVVLKSIEWIVSYRYLNSTSAGAEEGNTRQYLTSRVERSLLNRAACIKKYGFICQVCNEKMSDKYGKLASNFIHVHHIESLAASGARWIDPHKDLITVCPNCHSMLHQENPPIRPDKLKKTISVKK